MSKPKREISAIEFIEGMRKDARRLAMNSKYRKSGYKIICFLPWTEYNRTHTPPSEHPIMLVDSQRELIEGYQNDYPFDKNVNYVLTKSAIGHIESQTHILGYFIEVYCGNGKYHYYITKPSQNQDM